MFFGCFETAQTEMAAATAAGGKPAEDPGEKTNMGVDYVISYRFGSTGMDLCPVP